jgi:polyisoprenoid-binding protein YceI
MFKLRTLAAATLAFAAAGAFAQAASAPAATPGVDQRQANQEKRIDQGIASGELNKRETKRLEKEQNVIDRAENKAKADGTVTQAERRRLHKMQNHASRDIRRQKHDVQQAKP